MYSVYMHVTPSNKYYVGVTMQGCDKRWKNGLGYQTQLHFWRAIQKYGWTNIKHIIVAENLPREDALVLEQQLIAKYHSNNPKYGYNRTLGGDGTQGFSHKNPHSLEWRQKVSKSNMGKRRTDEAKLKMRQAKLGKHWSETRRLEYSVAQKNRHFHPSEKCINASKTARSIKIVILTVDGTKLGEFSSLTVASQTLGVSVALLSCLYRGKRTSKQYIVKKLEDDNNE